MDTLMIIPQRGVAYSVEGVEIGSIIIRPEHIAFIAGNWCRQISRKSKHTEILDLSREHNKRMENLIWKRKLSS